MIYQHALVRDVIRVVTTIHPFRAMHPRFFQDDEVFYEEPNPEKAVILRSRKTWRRNIKYIRGEEVSDEISQSYRMQPGHDSPVLNLFLTNRKVYSEAWPIFYEQNAFAFTIPRRPEQSALNCLWFLYDRPYHALQHIRKLHLLMGTCPHKSLQGDICSWPMTTILDEISRYLSLRVLVLYVRGTVTDAPMPAYMTPKVRWREEIMKVTGLEELHFDIISS